MALNLLKRYNHLLDIAGMSEKQRTDSLKRVFKRDFENQTLEFCGKSMYPTPKSGEIPMDTLFRHLTTEMTDKTARKRIFELNRSQRPLG